MISFIKIRPCQGRSDGGISVYIPPKSVHLKFLWVIFSSSYEAEHQQATDTVEAT